VPHTIELVVPAGQGKERLDLFLTNHLQNATRSKVQQGIRSGAVLVDGRPVRPSHHVTPGETIRVVLPTPPPQKAEPEPIPLSIIYEDEVLLVVNKPAGMVTHPAHGNVRGTLVNALLYHCRALSTVNGPVRAGIVHRLDKDTTGLMVVAKEDGVHARLARQFERRTIDREYWAVVWGTFRSPSGVIEAPLGRSRSDRKKIAVVHDGKHAVTQYEVVEEFEYLTLLRLHLRTGRTHQIRVHLSHIHHPVFGDPTYNGKRIMYGPGTSSQRAEVQAMLRMIPRQALHAKTIAFTHPVTNRRCTFDSSLPDDMSQILAFLRASARL
jgi:23S rRNA pseudouridine1911/1915/1917 synthase